MTHYHYFQRIAFVEQTNQLAACQKYIASNTREQCGKLTSKRIDGVWYCEDHIQEIKLDIIERKLDR